MRGERGEVRGEREKVKRMKGKEVRWASGKKLEGENDRRVSLQGFGNLEGWGCSLSYGESCKGDKNENKKSKKGEVRGETWAVKGLWGS